MTEPELIWVLTDDTRFAQHTLIGPRKHIRYASELRDRFNAENATLISTLNSKWDVNNLFANFLVANGFTKVASVEYF